jgi:hypothetical protein
MVSESVEGNGMTYRERLMQPRTGWMALFIGTVIFASLLITPAPWWFAVSTAVIATGGGIAIFPVLLPYDDSFPTGRWVVFWVAALIYLAVAVVIRSTA